MKYTTATAAINISEFNIGINNLRNVITVEIKIPKDKYNESSKQYDVDGSKLKSNPFITKIGLKNEKNELLAVAKLSKPLKKDTERDIYLTFNMDI